ncbi:MAG: globin [Glaciihabitans sp.]|nr:globin [Glaciihabitans sp.]
MSIYEQIGGQAVVKTAVTLFYQRVVTDPLLGKWFVGVDLSALRAHQRAFLAAALDGPNVYAGRDLGEAHAGMHIPDEAFTRLIEHLLTALADLEVDPQAIAAVEQKLEALRSVIVTA